MRLAIAKHWKDAVAIVALVAIAGYYILKLVRRRP